MYKCCYLLCIRYEDGTIFVIRRKALGVGGGGGGGGGWGGGGGRYIFEQC